VTEQEKAELFASKAPPLNQAERDAINALFPAYIFRRSRTDEIWTTCCRKHMVVEDKDMMVTTPERNFPAVMWEPHQREQRNRWDDAPKPNVRCPLCGRMVIVKELRCSGGRDNLSRYRRGGIGSSLDWRRQPPETGTGISPSCRLSARTGLSPKANGTSTARSPPTRSMVSATM